MGGVREREKEREREREVERDTVADISMAMRYGFS